MWSHLKLLFLYAQEKKIPMDIYQHWLATIVFVGWDYRLFISYFIHYCFGGNILQEASIISVITGKMKFFVLLFCFFFFLKETMRNPTESSVIPGLDLGPRFRLFYSAAAGDWLDWHSLSGLGFYASGMGQPGSPLKFSWRGLSHCVCDIDHLLVFFTTKSQECYQLWNQALPSSLLPSCVTSSKLFNLSRLPTSRIDLEDEVKEHVKFLHRCCNIVGV